MNYDVVIPASGSGTRASLGYNKVFYQMKDGKSILEHASSLFMEDEGVFIFDVNTPYKHKNILGNNTFIYDTDEVYCVWQNSTDESMLTEISLDIFEKDEDDEDTYYRYSEEFSERAYELDDIKK